MTENAKTTRIRQLNDAFRQSFNGGRVLLTPGVNELADNVKTQLLETVRTFRDFDEGNDPHMEHDFGSFEVAGENYFFKMDYYSPDLQGGSEDPADPSVTTRVLTIMRAAEY